MAKKKLAVPSDAWSHTEGKRGATIRVTEDWDRGGVVYLYRTVNRKPVKRSLSEYLELDAPFMLRNDRGEILKRQTDRAIEAAKTCVADLMLGLDPFRTSRVVRKPKEAAKAPDLRELFNVAVRSKRGMRVVSESQQQIRLSVSEHILSALGANTSTEDINSTTCEIVWRYFLDQSKGPDDQYRNAERAVQLLYSALNWAPPRDKRFTHTAQAYKGWKEAMSGEWAAKWKQKPGQNEQPRFDEEETALIYRRIAEADPRVRTMLESAPDQRAGQAIRATRRDLDLSEGAGELGFGTLHLSRHELGGKRAPNLSLTETANAEFQAAMSEGGYLYEMEQAYQKHLRGEEGGIEDYHLWPTGRMNEEGTIRLRNYLAPRRQKKGGVRTEPTHMTSNRLIELLHKYTDSIGIARVEDRAWYGLRRVMSDLAADVETDTRALREITNWKHEETRLRYHKRKNKKTLRKAAVARGKIRAIVSGEDNGEDPDRQEAALAILGADLTCLSTEQLLSLLGRVQGMLSENLARSGTDG